MPVPENVKKTILEIIAATSSNEPIDEDIVRKLQNRFVIEWMDDEFTRYRDILSGVFTDAERKSVSGIVYTDNLFNLNMQAAGLVCSSPAYILQHANQVRARIQILEQHEHEVEAIYKK